MLESSVIRLTSAQNPQIKQVVKLKKSSSFRRESRLFLLEGARLCLDAVSSGIIPRAVFYTEAAVEKYDLDPLFRIVGSRRFLVPQTLYKKISDTSSPQGVSCVCGLPQETREVDSLNPAGRYVALEGVQDPGNLGAIARTGEALGIAGLIVDSRCCDCYHTKALRASMGSLLRVDMVYTQDMRETIQTLNHSGFSTYAAAVRPPAEDVSHCRFGSGSVIVIGNEGEGLREATVNECMHAVTISMAGRAESLNAAAAASILIWEMMRGA